MTRSEIKYSKDFETDFVDYIGLGGYPNPNDLEWAYILPRETTREKWNILFDTESEAIKFTLFSMFWWDLKEENILPDDMPKDYRDNFVCNIKSIENIIKNYLIYDEMPPPYFKYLDFIGGKQSYNKIVLKETFRTNLLCITFNTDERIIIKKDDFLEQMFVPKTAFPEFKNDIAQIVSLIMGK